MKVNLFFVIFLISLTGICANAQPLNIQWQKCLGGTMIEEGFQIKHTSDGGYLTCGSTSSNDGDVSGNHSNQYDAWVVKLDSVGNIQWQKCYGGSCGELFYSMVILNNGEFVTVGEACSDDGDVIGMHNNNSGDYWVVCCNDTGGIMWQRCLGGSGGEIPYQIIKTYDHGFMVIGMSESSDYDVVGQHDSCSSQYRDCWLVKLDSVGNIEWSRCYGGCWADWGRSISQSPDSGYYFTAWVLSDCGDVQGLHGANNGAGGWPDYWVVKINSQGDIQWQKCLGGSGDETPSKIKVTVDGGCIVTGYTGSLDYDVVGNHGGFDIWIVKLDSLGNMQWQKCLGGSASDIGYEILPLSDGGYLSIGETSSIDGDLANNPSANGDDWIVKLDSAGSIEWQQVFGGSGWDAAYSADLSSDGGCILIGYSQSNDGDVSGNHGGRDSWVVKLSPLPDMLNSPQNPVSDFSVYLSRENDLLNVCFYANGNEHLQLQLVDMTGRTILQQSVSANAGFNKKIIQTPKLSYGIYIARLITENGVASMKIVTY